MHPPCLIVVFPPTHLLLLVNMSLPKKTLPFIWLFPPPALVAANNTLRRVGVDVIF